jgi:cytochrome bd-type quinol oxidase subunit 2
MKKVLLVLGVLVFFIGLPVAGSVYFWMDAHKKIRNRAIDYAEKTALPLLSKWDADTMYEQYSVDGRKNFSREKIAAYAAKFGPMVSHGALVPKRSYAGERDDNVWQFTVLEVPAVFEKGAGKVKLLITHKTVSSIWQIEDLSVD